VFSRRYKLLNQAALRLVKPGGLFMTCSCSGAVTQSNLLPSMVSEAAYKESRRLRLVRHAGPASDHPTDPSYPEGEYLTNLTYFVS
jgi:23S rRNA G2069 N7-methylase RlmK/C1962 C5-methylase RlmI